MPLAQDELTGRMRANLEATGGIVDTSAVLLGLVEAGRSREYAVSQAAAMETWLTGVPFRETPRKHPGADALSDDRLDGICRPERYPSRLGPVFERLAALT